MKSSKLPILGFSFLLAVSSCQKNDFNEESPNPAATSAVLNAVDTIGWTSSVQWETADQETFAVHYFTIEDQTITSDVADNGLVLLFKRSGQDITALPFEEGESTEDAPANYWYHQIMEGSLLVSCDVYSNKATPDAANSFKYFVITPEKLQSLQTDGHTTEKLMSLSYTEAAALLGGDQ
jgi:hypothetical protein